MTDRYMVHAGRDLMLAAARALESLERHGCSAADRSYLLAAMEAVALAESAIPAIKLQLEQQRRDTLRPTRWEGVQS